jgi:hypothetical protein
VPPVVIPAGHHHQEPPSRHPDCPAGGQLAQPV